MYLDMALQVIVGWQPMDEVKYQFAKLLIVGEKNPPI